MQLLLESHGERSFERISNLADTRLLARRVSSIVHNVLIDYVSLVFDSEGLPKWAPLAETTLIRRAFLGFGPGPILYRTGELRESLTDPSNQYHIYELKLSPQNSMIIFGSSLPRAFPLAHGDPEQPLPARPMFPPAAILHPELEGSITNAGRAI